MDNEIREVLAENEAKRNKPEQAEQTINPLDYVTISVKQYTKMIRKIERLKAELTDSERAIELTKENEKHYRWWREEEAKRENLEKQLAQAQEVIKQYKADYEKKLGIEVQDAES